MGETMAANGEITSFSDHVGGERFGAVLVVGIDNPPVNALSASVRAGLMTALAHAADNDVVTAVIITGAGKTFIGGADIAEFGKPAVAPLLPELIAAIEGSEKPVIATINGAALGGGLEVALACHVRIATPSAQLGLPEVKLGLVPGAGGTQRLPRLIGMMAALEMMASGKPVSGQQALESGLIDAAAEPGDLIQAAIDLAHPQAGKPLRRTGALDVPAFDAETFAAEAAKILKKARGQTAPAEVIRLVTLSAETTLAEGLAEERATFLTLRDSREAKALRHLFFAERAAGKHDGAAKPRPLGVIGIAGTGLMGSGIAVATLAAGFEVIALEQSEEAALAGAARIREMIFQSVKSGRLRAENAEEQASRLGVTARIEDMARADLVIEAVFDDLDVKIDLFTRLDSVLRPDAILATNTSYLDPDRIAAATAYPERVVGLHFFSPAQVMRLVEVVRCEKTAPDVLATALTFARRLKKIAVISGVTEGFIGNRIFSAYRNEAEKLIEEGALPQTIDRAMTGYGFAMGPFAVFDMAGLEIAWARRKRHAARRDPKAHYFAIPDRLCEAGRFGRKSGKGWYLYPEGKLTIDPEVDAMIAAYRMEKGLVAREIGDDEIVQRLLSAMAAEGSSLLAEGIAARANDVDVVMVHGYGFPAAKGGPMFAAGEAGD
jgi:3-hydroxyacyl-CoA dehydrogenase